MKIINLFLIIIILYLVYKIFTPLDNFDGTISVNDTNINANKNVFMNYKQNNLEQINDYKKLDLSKSNLIVNNVDGDAIKITNNLCIGNFCLNSSKLKTIAGKIDAPQFYKTVKDKYGDKVKEKIYYNHDCSLKNTDSEFNKCEITNQENLPDEMCFHFIDKEIIYKSHNPIESDKTVNTNKYVNNKQIYLQLNEFEINDVTYKINGKNKQLEITQQFEIKSNIKEYESDKLFDIITSIQVIGTPTQPINLYINKDKKTCINSKHFEILNGRRGLKLKHNTSNIPKILESVRLKQIEFMKNNKFPDPDNGKIYIEYNGSYKLPPTSDNLDGKVVSTEDEAKNQEIIFKSNYPNFVSDWYIYQTNDSGKLGKRDNTCDGGGKSTRFLPALPGKISGQCCTDFLNENFPGETYADKKDHDNKCLIKYAQKWAEDYNEFRDVENGAEIFNNKSNKQKYGDSNSSLCNSGYNSDSKWRLPPLKNNFKGSCCKDAYPGHTNKECTDKFEQEYPIYDTKKTKTKIDRGALGKPTTKCPKLPGKTMGWQLPDGYCCNDNNSNGRYHGINSKRDCIIKYHNKYSDSEYLETQPDTNEDKYMMPYYLDFRQIGSGIEGTNDQLLFKNDYECAHSNSLYKLNPKFDPRKYPLYRTKIDELNCKDYEDDPKKCWKNSEPPLSMDTYTGDIYHEIDKDKEASFGARLCPHTCKEALKYTFNKDVENNYKAKTAIIDDNDNKKVTIEFSHMYVYHFDEKGDKKKALEKSLTSVVKNKGEITPKSVKFNIPEKSTDYDIVKATVEFNDNDEAKKFIEKFATILSSENDFIITDGTIIDKNQYVCPLKDSDGALKSDIDCSGKTYLTGLFQCNNEKKKRATRNDAIAEKNDKMQEEYDKNYRDCIFGINPKTQREPMRKIRGEAPESTPSAAEVESLDEIDNYKLKGPNGEILGLRYKNGWLRDCPNINSNKSQVDDGKCIPKGTGSYTPKDLFNATIALAGNVLQGETGDELDDAIEEYIDKKNKGKNLHNICKSGLAEKDDNCKNDRNMKRYRCKTRWFKKDGNEISYEDKSNDPDWVSYDNVGKYCLKYQAKERNKDGSPENIIEKKDRGVDGKFKIYCPRLKAHDGGEYSPKGNAFKQKWGFDKVPKSADPNIIWSTGCCASIKKKGKFDGSRTACIKEYYRALREDETSENNNHGYYMLPKDQEIDQTYNGYYIDMNNNNVKYILKDNAIAKASSVLSDIQNHRASNNGLCGIDKFNGAEANYFCNSKNSNNGAYDNLCNPITHLQKEIYEYAGKQQDEPEEEEVATNCHNVKDDDPDYDNICITDNRCLKSNYKGVYQVVADNCKSGKYDWTPFSCKKRRGERNYRCKAQPKEEPSPPTEAVIPYDEQLQYKTQINMESIESPLDKQLNDEERKNMGELNYIMTPAKDINGENVSSDSYYHAHSHIHP